MVQIAVVEFERLVLSESQDFFPLDFFFLVCLR